ncbi:MAG: transcriptional regulator [Thermoproteota archaeon]
MSRDQAVEALLCVGSISGILAYGWLVFASEWAMLILQLTGFIAVAAVLGILSWIGYTLATTPTPKLIEKVLKHLVRVLSMQKSKSL